MCLILQSFPSFISIIPFIPSSYFIRPPSSILFVLPYPLVISTFFPLTSSQGSYIHIYMPSIPSPIPIESFFCFPFPISIITYIPLILPPSVLSPFAIFHGRPSHRLVEIISMQIRPGHTVVWNSDSASSVATLHTCIIRCEFSLN